MSPIVAPWTAEILLISWRSVRRDKRPPYPSELLATFVIFGAASLVANSQPKVAGVFAWGVVIATALNYFDPATGKPKATATETNAAASHPSGVNPSTDTVTRYGPH